VPHQVVGCVDLRRVVMMMMMMMMMLPGVCPLPQASSSGSPRA
jgi:hypothetical protein